MNIAEPFIRRPVATTLITMAMVVFGVMAYLKLPVSDLPNVDFPTIQVSAGLPGASPETMAASVATPLEREFSTIAGVDSMSSSSSLGSTQITLQFTLDRNIDAAAQDVQAAISRTLGKLPDNMPSPPSYRKVNPADEPILYLSVISPTLPLYQVYEYADTFLAQRISTVRGVSQVEAFGPQKYAVRIQVNPNSLASRQLGIDEVSRAIQAANVNLPTGVLYGKDQAFTIEATGQLTEASAYRSIIIKDREGRPVRLEEIGQAIDSVANDKQAAWFVTDKTQRAIVLAIRKQPGSNTVATVDRIRELLPTLQAQVPAAVGVEVLYDRSETIRASIEDVQFTLALTLGLVVMVIFLFLRNLRATIIPSLAMPLSIIGTFAAMHQLGFSLNNLSLMALTLSVGFVVDDAIVMLENIVRHIEMGEKPFQAALQGAREIGFTIVSMTLSLAAVFIPVLFMGGLLGRLLNEFAITIAVAILVSGFVSLTLTPMMCSRLLREHGQVRHGRVYRLTEKAFDAMLWLYRVTLRGALRAKPLIVVASLAILAATGWLYRQMPRGFLPTEDTGRIRVRTEAAEGTSFEAMVRYQQEATDIVRADPNTGSFMTSAGARSGGNANLGFMFLTLKPRDERPLSAEQVVQQLRPKLAHIPGLRVYLTLPPPIEFGGRGSKSQYQFTLQSPDTDELYHYAPLLEARVRQWPGLVDVTTDLQLKNPQVHVVIDRDKASLLQVSADQIETALASAYGSRQISTIYAPNNDYDVILELEPQYQREPEALSLLYVRSARGQLVPLDAVARIERAVGPSSVAHQGQLPAVTLSFNLAPGTSLGDAVAVVDREAKAILPATIATSFQGTAQAFQDSTVGLWVLLVLAVFVIYFVLGVLYESFIHPLTILTALPFAGFGALATLYYFHMELSLYAFVGIIMLVGLVKKNGIMMIDFAIVAQRDQGKSPEQAIYDACIVRFRPIMMTTMAALMGTLPIALGYGAGAEARRPLGLAVVGGLVFSQTLTLYVTPVFYLYMEQLQGWLRGGAPRGAAAVARGGHGVPTAEAEVVPAK